MTVAAWFNADVLRLLVSIYVLLIASLACGWYQAKIKGNTGILNFYNRTKSWVVIVLVVSVVFLFQDYGLRVFFAALLLVGLFELEFFKRKRGVARGWLLPLMLIACAVYAPVAVSTFFVGFTVVLVALLFSRRFSVYYARLHENNLMSCWLFACLYHLVLLLNENDANGRLDICKVVFFVILASQINDILQYIMGKLYGRKLTFKIISPHKTREGYVYGFAASFVVCLAVFGYLISPLGMPGMLMLTVAVILAGATGDLIFSAIKRSRGIKDFSGLIPHHGGLLDRFDSLILALPVSYYGWMLIR